MSENPLIGYWKLISCVAVRNRGARVPLYGKHPIGRLYYDAAGNMSVHIMRAGRRAQGHVSDLAGGDELPYGALSGYQAYFATYHVDTDSGIVRHKVLGSWYPDWTGTTQIRYYELQHEDRLLLRNAPIGSGAADEALFELTWERIPDDAEIVAMPEIAIAHR